jgi:hypothetical protein
MVQETFFSVAQLQDLMRQGQWHDALTLLSRFLQVDDDRLLSLEAQVLCRFLSAHRNLADILAGSVDGRVLGASLCNYLTHDRNFCHGDLRLKSIMLTVLHAKQLLRCVGVGSSVSLDLVACQFIDFLCIFCSYSSEEVL